MLEGTVVNVTDKSGGAGSGSKRGGISGSGSLGNGPGLGGGKAETHGVDTSNILFILSGAFMGLEKTVQSRVAKGVRKRKRKVIGSFLTLILYISAVYRF